jgi:hypothetical protein
MNDVTPLPSITKKKAPKNFLIRNLKNETFKNSYLQHLYEYRDSKSPLRETNLSPNSIKKPKVLPPIPNPRIKFFKDPLLQQKYEEINHLYT